MRIKKLQRKSEMFKTRTIGAAAIAVAAAFTLASVTPSFAAHHRHHPAGAETSQPRYYNYVPSTPDNGGLSRFHGGPGQYGPPDPASCGGFAC
jgi:hypothetical protein